MCTVFANVNHNSIIVAKNHDNFIQNGMVFTNHRGMQKHALTFQGENVFQWKAEYGSLTFSQCGKNMPVNGINEKGLIVEQATLPETVYPEKDHRPEISCLEAIQYLLDTCKNTDEVLNSFDRFRINQTSWTIHYFIIDNTGHIAIVEFLKGEMIVHSHIELPVMTNSLFDVTIKNESISNLNLQDDYQKNSMERYNRIQQEIKDKKEISIPEAFSILDKARRDDTVWCCVYEARNPSIYFTSIYNPKKMKIQLDDIDFSKSGTPLLYDLNSNHENISFIPYSREKNKKNIEDFFNNQLIINIMNLPNSTFIINTYDEHINSIEKSN